MTLLTFCLCAFLIIAAGLVTATVSTTISGFASGGGTYQISGDVGTRLNPTVAAATTGTLTTRTNDTTGSITAIADHGLTTSQRVDLFWDGGARLGVVLGTVSGNTVPITNSGTGSVLPIATTALTIGKCEEIPAVIVGDDIRLLFIGSAVRGAVVVEDSGGNTLLSVALATNGYYEWNTNYATANPLAGDTTGSVFFSHTAGTTNSNMQLVAVTKEF